MRNNMDFKSVEGKCGIKATVVADSVNVHGDRLTTMTLQYPRMIHCFDDETQILTQIGDELPVFRHFKAVQALGCKVAQYNADTEEISFVYPTSYVEQYSDSHSMVSIDRKTFNMSVTEGHRVLTKKRTTDNVYVNNTMLAKDLLEPYAGIRRVMKSGVLRTHQSMQNEEISLIIYYVAEGHRTITGDLVQFTFHKDRKTEKVVGLLTALGIAYKIAKYEKFTIIKFSSPWWVSSCYNDEGDKILPDALYFMDDDGYTAFKTAALESDGCIQNNEYNTGSADLANQMQVIAHLHNDAMNIREYSGMYKQKFLADNYVTFSTDNDTFDLRRVKFIDLGQHQVERALRQIVQRADA